ncbi:MAG TPA: MFS transporter [Myxococcota bacterium]
MAPRSEAPSLRRRALAHGVYWFLAMTPLGLMLPYFALYLREEAGLSGAEIGAVMAVMPAVAMFCQPFWGIVADRTGLRARTLVVLCAGAAAGYLAIGAAEGLRALLAATALLAVFARALIPLSLSVSIPAFADHAHAFGLVRALGTIGFGVAMFGFPALLASAASASGRAPAGLGLLFPAAAVLSGAAALAALALPAGGALALRAAPGEWRSLARNGPFVRLLALGVGAFLFQNGPLELFPVLVRARGGDYETIRTMWVWMLVPEVVLIALLGAALARFAPRSLLAIGLLANGVRWLGTAGLESLAWLAPLQALHAVVVLGLMLGGPLYLDAAVPAQLRSTAQAGFAVVSVGVGGTASSLLSGWLLDVGGPAAPCGVAGAGSLLLALAARRWLPRVRGGWREAG